MSILGNRVIRKEDPHLITGKGSYVDSLPLPGAAYVTFVRSTMAHATIQSIDAEAARSAPGVIDVVTASDLDIEDLAPGLPMLNALMTRPVLARDKVRFAGEPVAAIVTEERYQGPDAAESLWVDYAALPALTDPEASLTDEILLFEEAGSNVVIDFQFGVVDNLMEGTDVVVSQRLVNQRLAPTPIEVRAAAAEWEGDRLTFYASTQAPHGVKGALAQALRLEPEAVRVLCADVGGGFGAKGGISPEEILVAWLARHLARPVKWMENRTESMLAMTHGRGQIQDMELGATRDGKLVGLRAKVLQDGGAYPALGPFLPFLTRMMSSGVYVIPQIEFNATSVATTTTPTSAYRGAGRPEAAYAIERMMDILADEIGMDPAELRRKNLIPKDQFPFDTPTGATYDIGDYEGALDKVLAASGYKDLLAAQKQRRESGQPKQLGIGLSLYVEITNGVPGAEFGAVEVHADGSATVRTASSPHGQGHVTAWAMIASDRLGIPMDKIEVVHGDTDKIPFGVGTFGSRSAQTGGVTTAQAADKVVEKAKKIAAEELEASPDDIVLDTGVGRFHVAGSPTPFKEWADLVAASPQALAEEVSYEAAPSFPFGAHVAVVEVDTETGKVQLIRMVAVDDAGRILNPLLLEGQVHGGLAQGIAQALLEEVIYDSEGNMLTSNLADYATISSCELPSFETVKMETPTPLNELGAKGVGESGTIGSTPAVVNAVVDAVSHLGVRHIDMPMSPIRVWEAIQAARQQK
jgi:aerobic carbon-monoxide dehydrogenase large subunit